MCDFNYLISNCNEAMYEVHMHVCAYVHLYEIYSQLYNSNHYSKQLLHCYILIMSKQLLLLYYKLTVLHTLFIRTIIDRDIYNFLKYYAYIIVQLI